MEEVERLTKETSELDALITSLQNQIRLLTFDKLDVKRLIKLHQKELKTLKIYNFVKGYTIIIRNRS